jgi:SgrR family transcriptional regulator
LKYSMFRRISKRLLQTPDLLFTSSRILPPLTIRPKSRIQSESSIRKFVTCNTKKKGPLSDPLLRADILSCLIEDCASMKAQITADPPVTLQIATIPQYAGDAEYIASRLARHGYACSVVSVSPEEFKGPITLESDLIRYGVFFFLIK